MGMKGFINFAFNSFLGGLAVTFFFVLSGFLITSLLLTEKARSGTIRVGRFLTRRALRIWPLYYLVLVAGYGIAIFLLGDTPADPLRNGFLLNLLLLPNVAFTLGLLPDILIQIWSIGTEEQFYFVWPFLIRRAPAAKLIYWFLAIILFWIVSRPLAKLAGEEWLNILLFRTRIDCMAFGGLGALMLYYRERAFRWILHPLTGWVAGITFLLLLAVSYRWDISLYQLYAILSGILILRVITRPVGWLESRMMKYLGKISYGIYLLQHFALYFIFKVWMAKGFFPFSFIPGNSLAGAVVMFVLGAMLTVGLAAVSYSTFESRWLKRKF
jgi:peptidoglycan/LPS O-acetylase OafA/YrhL